MNDKGGTMKPELEALYEGAQAVGCPHISHQQRSPGALLQLCEDWQEHAFAVEFTAAVRLLTK